MIDMKMRAEHGVDLVGVDACGGEAIQIVVAGSLVPGRADRARLAAADAGVDQHDPIAEAKQNGVPGQMQHLGGRCVMVRHQPGQHRVEIGRSRLRQQRG